MVWESGAISQNRFNITSKYVLPKVIEVLLSFISNWLSTKTAFRVNIVTNNSAFFIRRLFYMLVEFEWTSMLCEELCNWAFLGIYKHVKHFPTALKEKLNALNWTCSFNWITSFFFMFYFRKAYFWNITGWLLKNGPPNSKLVQ